MKDTRELLQIVGTELNQCAGGNDNDFIDSNRKDALAYYLGQADGKEVEGRSSVVSTDVADAIEWIMPQIMEQLTKNNEVVSFDPTGPGDEDQAELETNVVYDIFMKDNENTVIVGNLKGGHTLYRICVEDQIIAERALSTQSVEILTNCVELHTQTDYNTLAGWVLAVLLSVTIVLLMYSQRDKIEILYFNSPVYIPKALQDSLASHDVAHMANMTETAETPQRVSNGTTSVTSSGR